MCRACGYVGTKASMTKHQATCSARQPSDGPTHDAYRLRVSGTDLPAYWLDVELTTKATLDDLDGFLRGIWLECCGHLSSFTIGPQDDEDFDPFRASKGAKQPLLTKLGIQPGDKFGYTYDFGSSTDLTVQVQALESVSGKAADKVRLLARNLPPIMVCSLCTNPATWVHGWEVDEDTGGPLLYCNAHGKKTREEQLPVVNSPRMGVCAYEGGSDDDWPPAAPKVAAQKQPAEEKPRRASTTAPSPEPAAPMILRLGQDTTPEEIRGFLEPLTLDLIREHTLTAFLKDVKELPHLPQTVWTIGMQKLPYALPPNEDLPTIVLIVDAVSEQIVASEMLVNPTVDDLQQIVLAAMLDPAEGRIEPQRPGRILIMDAALAVSLQPVLDPLSVQVERQVSPELERLFTHLAEDVGAEMLALAEGQRPRPFLQAVPDQDVRALREEFERFIQARPWQNFAPDQPLRASWASSDGISGQLYATLLGDRGEVYGLALYPDWLSYTKQVVNSFNPELVLLGTGGLERLALSEKDDVHPDDWARLLAAGMPVSSKAGPALTRISLTGTQPPVFPIRPLTAVLRILSERAERKGTPVTSMKAQSGEVSLQYPAGPRDELSDQERAGSVQLRLTYDSGTGSYEGEVVLTGPPEMMVKSVFAQARRILEAKKSEKGRFHVPVSLESTTQMIEDGGLFGDLPVRFWGRGAGNPALTLAHLVKLGPLIDGGITAIDVSTQEAEVTDLTVALRPKPKKTAGDHSAKGVVRE
jgi:hypothetical protein